MTSTPRQYAQPGTPPQGTLKIEGGTNAFTKMTNIGTVRLVVSYRPPLTLLPSELLNKPYSHWNNNRHG